jgi:hypothetical protein
MKNDEAKAIIARLKDVLQVDSDGQLANYLGISRQNIGAARKRQEVPPGWIYRVAELTGCSMDWLRFGHGPRKRAQYTQGEIPPGGQVASSQSPYDSEGSPKSSSPDEMQPAEDTSGFGAAVEMLAKIYASDDKLMIGTINANIRAFCEAIASRQREQRSMRELENLKNRLNLVERQLKPGHSIDPKTDEADG